MIERKFNFGTEWIYLKVYSGPQTLENILLKEFFVLFKDLHTKKVIEKFFFIRFADDFHHLRIRFKVLSLENVELVVNLINSKLDYYIKERLIWNLNYTTYNREFERYGIENIDDCETIFCYSSWQALSILEVLTEGNLEDKRWLWACKTIDLLLNHFNLTLEDKFHLFDNLVSSYSGEYNLTKISIIKLNDKFREVANEIEIIMQPTIPGFAIDISPDLERHYSIAINNIINRQHSPSTGPTTIFLLRSLIHMHLNRLFQTRQRKNEFVVCYLMHKYYRSQVARTKTLTSI